ncbi:MAG: DUF5011 domain-containing protein [Gammaproteobacteria bacterium]|nr:DUF5011 domain-containing protein [Gammaproteobacteria bacterium]
MKKNYPLFFLFFISSFITACGGGAPGEQDSNNAIPTEQVSLKAPADIQYTEFDGKIRLSWNSVKGAEHYKIYLSTEPDTNLKNAIITNTFDSILLFPDLLPNTPYYVVLSSINNKGEEILSPEFQVILTTPNATLDLTPPINFTATAGEGKISLSWEPLPEAISYILYYSNSDPLASDINAQQIREIGNSFFNHQKLQTGVEFYYRLSAVTPAGLTQSTEVISATPTTFSTPPPAPESFSASSGDRLVALRWKPVDNASSYKIYMATEPNVTAENVNTLQNGETLSDITNISTNRLNLVNDTTYYFSISALNAAGEGPTSVPIAATPKEFMATVPGNIRTDSQDKNIKISWDAVEDASEYSVYWSTNPTADKQSAEEISGITETQFTHINVTSSEVIYYFITAHNENGESEKSAIASATPQIIPAPPQAPFNIRIDVTQGRIFFEWDEATDAEEHIIYLASQPGITKENYFQLDNGARLRYISLSSFSKTGLLPGTNYYIRISAVNAGGEGTLSQEIRFNTKVDITPPFITLIGDNPLNLFVGDTYVEAGATANDPEDGNVSANIIVNASNVNTAQAGTYQVTYNVADSTGNNAVTVNRDVTVSNFSLSVNNPGLIEFGSTHNLTAFASSSTFERDVTHLANWATTTSETISISNEVGNKGTINAVGIGNANIGVEYNGIITSINMSVADLSPPTNLTATPGSLGVALNWAPNNNGGTYYIYRSNNLPITSSSSFISETTGTRFFDNNVSPGSTYFYAVSTVAFHNDNLFQGNLSDVAEVTAWIPIELKAFSDLGLAQCIKDTLLIYIEQLTDLNCDSFYDGTIGDLSGIDTLKALVSLNMTYSRVSDLSPLATLSNLTTIEFNSSQISDISPLSAISSLQNVYLRSNKVIDISPLEKLQNLVNLDLWGNSISNVTPINNLQFLAHLNLGNNLIDDVSSLTNLPSLSVLDLESNNLTNIDNLKNFSTLTKLDLGVNHISKINALSDLDSLTNLRLNVNNIIEVSPLFNLIGLIEVNLNDNSSLSCETVQQLDKIIDKSDGEFTGAVIWTTCLLSKIGFDNGSIDGWTSKGLAAYDTETFYYPDPSAISWDDNAHYPNVPGKDSPDSNGSLQLSSSDFRLPEFFPVRVPWYVDLISPDLTLDPSWQYFSDLSISVANRQGTGTILIQPIINATQLDTRKAIILEELDAKGTPVFYPVSATGAWDNSINPYFGDLSNYTINNLIIRVLGNQTSGPLKLNFDNITADLAR